MSTKNIYNIAIASNEGVISNTEKTNQLITTGQPIVKKFQVLKVSQNKHQNTQYPQC